MSRGFHIVIPARYASTRLPGKPLLEIAGRPLVMHVWDAACRAGARSVRIATDDARVLEAVRAAGAEAVMTSSAHSSGTDRLAEVAAAAGWSDDAIVVNVQGDEPLVPPTVVRALGAALEERSEAGVATCATPIRESGELWSPHVVKVVLDRDGFALYFSRAPIPWARDSFGAERPADLPSGVPYLRHLGLYAYRVATLRCIYEAAPSPHERAEALEQLRVTHLRIPIHVTVVDEAPSPGVDTHEDLERVRRMLEDE